MLLEYALLLHRAGVVPIKGVWVDPNQEVHEGRLLNIERASRGVYSLTIDGMWGNSPVSVSQDAPTSVVHRSGPPSSEIEVQFGSLLLQIDHHRDNPIEWLSEYGLVSANSVEKPEE